MNKLQKIICFACVVGMLSSCAAYNKTDTISNNTTTAHNGEQVFACPATAPEFTQDVAVNLLQQWGKDLQWSHATGGIESAAVNLIANNYQRNAVLLPTLSGNTRNTKIGLYSYFAGSDTESGFLTKHPEMSINQTEQHVDAMGCGYGVYSGKYDFVVYPNTPKSQTVHARYTYVYRYISEPVAAQFVINGKTIIKQRKAGWYIVQHNSAFIPD